MTDFLHIIERELYHFGWGVTAALMFYFLFRFLQRHVILIANWIGKGDRIAMILAALCTFIVSVWREPYDAAQPGALVFKSTIDSAVWLISPLIGVYAAYRIKYKD